MEIIVHQSLISCLTSETYRGRDGFVRHECSLFFSPTYQNNYVSNDEESLVLDFRDHSHAEYGRYFFTCDGEGGFCREGRLDALET